MYENFIKEPGMLSYFSINPDYGSHDDHIVGIVKIIRVIVTLMVR